MAYKTWIAGILQEEQRQTQDKAADKKEDIGRRTQVGCKET